MGYLPLEPVSLVSQWIILKIKKDNLTEWSSLQGKKRWVGGRKQTKGKRAVKVFDANRRANLSGNETNAYAQGDHLLANRKSPSNYDYWKDVSKIFLPVSSVSMTKGKKPYQYILMDWSWCPSNAIMASASSNTNIFIFFGSSARLRRIQSSRVPGVAKIMWSVTFWPLDTVERRRRAD